jgi:deoxyribose-phosphate aldolase
MPPVLPEFAIDPHPRVAPDGLQQRVDAMNRPLPAAATLDGLRRIAGLTDLTTLSGADTPGKVRALCQRAISPLPTDPLTPHTAAVCVHSRFTSLAVELVKGSDVRVAAVATAFPAGQVDDALRYDEVRAAVAAGAHEIDMVIRRTDALLGQWEAVEADVRAVKQACGDARLKVILETGELQDLNRVRRASWTAMRAGADFIKTSTGKVTPAATLPVTLCMLDAIADFHTVTGLRVGMKPAGGIRTSTQALQYLSLVSQTLGDSWIHPHWFRFGASSLLTDVLYHIERLHRGGWPARSIIPSLGAY